MPVSKRLTVAGGGDDSQPIAPSGVDRSTELSRSGVDSTLRTFESASLFRDARPNQVQVITVFTGTYTSFTLSGSLNGENKGATVPFVRLTNATAAAIQAALRTMFPLDTALTVTGTTDTGPFTVTFTRSLNSRQYPNLTIAGVIGTGGGAVSIDRTNYFTGYAGAEGDATIGLLGESDKVSSTVTILKPTIGAITVTPGVGAVQTITHTDVSDGTFDVGYKGRVAPGNQWNITAAALQTVLRALHPDLAAVTVSSDVSPRVVTFVGSGKPIDLLNISAYGLTGGVFTIATTTPGLFGTISVAYTENDAGDSVLAAAVNDVTGESFGFVNDAASPVVIGVTTGLTGMTPGAYHVIARTVKSGRVSKADNKAFTMTSS